MGSVGGGLILRLVGKGGRCWHVGLVVVVGGGGFGLFAIL